MSQAARLMPNVLIVLFLWSLNLSVGLSYTVHEVLAPFRNGKLIALAIGLNVIAIPLVYFGLARFASLAPDYAIGFLLVGFASAGPSALKYVGLAKADVPLAAGLIVVLGASNVAVIPLWASFLMPHGTSINTLGIVLTLVVLVLVPLALGLLAKARVPRVADRWAPRLETFSHVALALVFAAVLLTSWSAIVSVSGSWVIPVALVALAVQMVAGYRTSEDREASRTLSIVTGVRATSPALAIAKAAFRSSQTVVATVMVVAVIAFLPLPLALWWASARSAELASEDVTAEHNAPAD